MDRVGAAVRVERASIFAFCNYSMIAEFAKTYYAGTESTKVYRSHTATHILSSWKIMMMAPKLKPLVLQLCHAFRSLSQASSSRWVTRLHEPEWAITRSFSISRHDGADGMNTVPDSK